MSIFLEKIKIENEIERIKELHRDRLEQIERLAIFKKEYNSNCVCWTWSDGYSISIKFEDSIIRLDSELERFFEYIRLMESEYLILKAKRVEPECVNHAEKNATPNTTHDLGIFAQTVLDA